MKRKKTGFTLVELLTVLAIITMLIGLLVPAMATVRRFAKETKQGAQLTTIGLALTAFRDDYGDYPPSDPYSHIPGAVTQNDYCGTQKLAEALLGWDLLGFHPNSGWRSDGLDIDGLEFAYDPDKLRGDVSLHERRGRYLELTTANAFRLGDLFADTGPELAPATFVICDVFTVKPVPVGAKTVKAGTPILYYRANTASKNIDNDPTDFPTRIYNYYDNVSLVGLNKLTDSTKFHRLANSDYFYDEYIVDFKVTSIPWPHRPDSYILISAGMDGEYGTADDITNFGD